MHLETNGTWHLAFSKILKSVCCVLERLDLICQGWQPLSSSIWHRTGVGMGTAAGVQSPFSCVTLMGKTIRWVSPLLVFFILADSQVMRKRSECCCCCGRKFYQLHMLYLCMSSVFVIVYLLPIALNESIPRNWIRHQCNKTETRVSSICLETSGFSGLVPRH